MNNIVNYFKRGAYCDPFRKFSNFVYDHSGETALVMLVFNGLSIRNSHKNQMAALRKSKKDEDTKNYLIKQEENEKWLDYGFSILISFIVNSIVKKAVEGGKIMTKDFAEKYRLVARDAGIAESELYSTEHIIKTFNGTYIPKLIIDKLLEHNVPFRKVLENLSAKCGKRISNVTKFKMLNAKILKILMNSKRISESFKEKLKEKKVTEHLRFEKPSNKKTIKEICAKFDDESKDPLVNIGTKKLLRNQSAIDELAKQAEGLALMATIGYLILSSNIITPILKNIWANKSYEKELASHGETRESMRRKKRFAFANTNINDNKPEIFSTITNESNNIKSNMFRTIDLLNGGKNTSSINYNPQTTFNGLNKYKSYTSQSTGLRI